MKPYFKDLYQMFIYSITNYPEEYQSYLGLLFNIVDCEIFEKEVKENTKEVVELLYKTMLNSLEKKDNRLMVEIRGAMAHFFQFADSEALLKIVLPLQSNFFKDDLNLKCSAIFMFVPLVTLQLESVYKFIQKTYPIFLKNAMDKKQDVAFRLSCLYAVHFINNHYLQILVEYKDEVVKMIKQFLEEDLSKDEEFIFNLLCIIHDINETDEVEPLQESETIELINPLMSNLIGSDSLMIFSFPDNEALFAEIQRISFEILNIIEDISFLKDILDKALKHYKDEIEPTRIEFVSHLLAQYFMDSDKKKKSEFQNYTTLFEHLSKSDRISVLINLPTLIPLTNDKGAWKSYFKKIMKHLKSGEQKAFDFFVAYTSENTPFLQYILANINVFLEIFEKLFSLDHFQLKGKILEVYGNILDHYKKDHFVKKCYNYSLTSIEYLNSVDQEKCEDYESRIVGTLNLVNSLIESFDTEYQGLKFENFISPLFEVMQKTKDSVLEDVDDILMLELDLMAGLMDKFGQELINSKITESFQPVLTDIISNGIASEDEDTRNVALLIAQFTSNKKKKK